MEMDNTKIFIRISRDGNIMELGIFFDIEKGKNKKFS